MDRQVDAVWNRSGKTLNIVIGTIHIPLTATEAEQLRDRLAMSVTLPTEWRAKLASRE